MENQGRKSIYEIQLKKDWILFNGKKFQVTDVKRVNMSLLGEDGKTYRLRFRPTDTFQLTSAPQDLPIQAKPYSNDVADLKPGDTFVIQGKKNIAQMYRFSKHLRNGTIEAINPLNGNKVGLQGFTYIKVNSLRF